MTLNKPSDLKDWACETIKKMILNAEVEAGEQLHIETLSEQMGISRTPIREALLRLESEGLVRSASRVGFFVQEVTKQDLNELFELREILESYAAAKAAPLIRDEEIEIIGNLQNQAVKAVQSGNLKRFIETDIALHSLILNNSKNQRLMKMLESIKDLTYRERILSLRSARNVEESLKEHQKIFEALKRRDGNLAGQMMREHISAIKERLLSFLDLPERANKEPTGKHER
jgi:DNA-binding GntR family transcriptional regulator